MHICITTIDFDSTTVRERVVGKDEKRGKREVGQHKPLRRLQVTIEHGDFTYKFITVDARLSVKSKSDLFKVQSTTF